MFCFCLLAVCLLHLQEACAHGDLRDVLEQEEMRRKRRPGLAAQLAAMMGMRRLFAW